MNISRQTVWRLHVAGGYWINRAIDAVLERDSRGFVGPNDLGQTAFDTREAVIDFAAQILRRYTDLTPNAWSLEHSSTEGFRAALAEIGRTWDARHDIVSSTRWAGDPTISVNERNEVVLTRPTEFQLTATAKTIKSVTDAGGTATREVEEMRTSALHPGEPEIVRFEFWAEGLVMIS